MFGSIGNSRLSSKWRTGTVRYPTTAMLNSSVGQMRYDVQRQANRQVVDKQLCVGALTR